MASLLPLRLICGSMFLLFTVLGTALSFRLSPLDQMKMYWTQNGCVFPSPTLYQQKNVLLQQEANPVLQSCENPESDFHETLCSTFFNVSMSLCSIKDVSLTEHLQHDVLAKSVYNVTWNVCYYAQFIGIPALFEFITQDPTNCKRQCEENPQTAPVCKWLIAAVVNYIEVQSEAEVDTDRARKEGGTAGQQQSDQAKVDETRKDDYASASGQSGVPNGTVSQEAAQTTHMIPENDSDGARANKPNGLGTEPPTREETLPLKNVSDAKIANEQKTIPENVLTNDSNVTKTPLSVRTTQHPRYADKPVGDLTPGLQTGKPKPPLENSPQPSSTTPSTPLNSKSEELQRKGGKEGGTAGQQQSDQAEVDETRKDDYASASGKSGVPNGPVSKEAAQTAHTVPENDSEGATPLNSKWGELQGNGDEEKGREQDQEESGHETQNYNDLSSRVNQNAPSQVDWNNFLKGDQNLPSRGNELQSKVDSDVYHGSEDGFDDDELPSCHFMAYFVTAFVLCVVGYVIYHNNKKIFAFVLEGRREGQQRRRSSAGSSSGGSSAKYHKLTPSVEEVMPSLEQSTSSTNYIYYIT